MGKPRNMKGIQRGKSYGSLDDTVILIEADESTPLLVDRGYLTIDGNNNAYRQERALMRDDGLSLWSFTSSNASYGSKNSTKSFRSHFWELKVLAFVLVLLSGLSVAIYLLIIESRFPSITFSLDLVHHDVWSRKQLTMGKLLNPINVDSVIITQTGSQNCDNSYQCMKVLQEMQEDYSRFEELPYNFVIGGEGVAYEVRGWNFASGMPAVKQSHSLVIGIMGNYDQATLPSQLLKAANFLIIELTKRRKLQKSYRVYGPRKFCPDCQDEHEVFKKIVEWPKIQNFP